MAGLTAGGFIPDTYEAIRDRIQARLELFSPGFDFSPESPDGQLIDIHSFEFSKLWQELGLVYNSYNPYLTTGAGLRNLGLITGLPYGAASRSYATIETQGTAGTVIPTGSLVSGGGQEFYVTYDTTIPSNAVVVAVVAGEVVVDANTIDTIEGAVSGWTGVTQTQAGVKGTLSQTESQFRNTRQNTVMRGGSSVAEVMQARLIELGLGQAKVINNTSPTATLPDGTPPNTIQVTVGEIGSVSTVDIAQAILDTNGLGCPTFGNTSEVLTDSQGVSHEIFFSLATQVAVEVVVQVTFLDQSTAGAIENITNALYDHINLLKSGEDVVWSRLFSYITPFAKAQVDVLTIAKTGDAQGVANIVIDDDEFASVLIGAITVTET